MSVPPSNQVEQRFKWLPPMGSWKFHLMLGAIAILILGPLGGVTATYMNFAIGFFVGGQVLAGILGSAVTFGYGAEGKHGANYMQTLAASVASMAAMAVLIQAMHWLGFEVPEAWKLVIFYLCIGMFGVGVGMLYTPLLVDKMQLTYPSGLAVANILRALTDKVLLKMSIGKLAIGTGIGAVGGALAQWVPFVGSIQFSGATFGAGMIVGARIGIPAIVVGLIGEAMHDDLVASGWLAPGEPFRKIFFVIALGTILGAAVVDIALVAKDFFAKLKMKDAPAAAGAAGVEAFKKVSMGRLYAWVGFWAVATFLVATQMFGQEALYVIVSILLVFVFMIVNGISMGISDSNPISSAFVLTVFILSGLGLGAATGGLVCASILLIAVSIGGDMQQDRSTGWRLGTSRVNQFRYQVIGVSMGAVLAVAMAGLFSKANPQLLIDQTEPKEVAAYVERQAILSLAEARAAAEAGIAPEKFDDMRAAWTDAERAAFKAKQEQHADAIKTQLVAGGLGPNEKTALETAKKIEQQKVDKWQSAMTYKFVGALSVFMDRPIVEGVGNTLSTAEESLFEKAFRAHKHWYPAVPAALAGPIADKYAADLKAEAQKDEPKPVDIPAALGTPEARKAYAKDIAQADRAHKKAVQTEALLIGISIGLVIEILRKMLKKSARYQAWKKSGPGPAAAEFVIDSTVLASPYASSFGGFVELWTSIWFGVGGAFASTTDWLKKKYGKKEVHADLPEDMSTNSLVGGGLIAGESLFFLVFGIVSLLTAL